MIFTYGNQWNFDLHIIDLQVKEIARQYDERGGTSIYEDELRYEEDNHHAWDYEDEYDDTYDDNEARNIDDLGVEKAIKRWELKY